MSKLTLISAIVLGFMVSIKLIETLPSMFSSFQASILLMGIIGTVLFLLINTLLSG
jgi:hypothetical protein